MESQPYLVEVANGAQTIKAIALEPIMYQRWETVLACYVTAPFRASHLSGVASALGQVIQHGSTLAIPATGR